MMYRPSKASLRGSRNRSNSISSIAAKTSPAFRVFRLAFMAKLFALLERGKKKFLRQEHFIPSKILSDAYQDVAYNTKTLAAWDIALLASFDTFTPSGSWLKTQITISTVLYWFLFKTLRNDDILIQYVEIKQDCSPKTVSLTFFLNRDEPR